ncbi:MAG: helix-turn-helix transcriptional regulator [Cytophagales bacterium]|nr:helix-turn-helix transcriptional regulator [Cytophagales bacterium]
MPYQKKGIDFGYELPKQVVVAHFDPESLREVLTFLCDLGLAHANPGQACRAYLHWPEPGKSPLVMVSIHIQFATRLTQNKVSQAFDQAYIKSSKPFLWQALVTLGARLEGELLADGRSRKLLARLVLPVSLAETVPAPVSAEPLPPPHATEPFWQTLELTIAEHLSNPDYGVDALAHDLGMSRSYLFKKIKSRYGISAAAYLRICRLDKAKELLLGTSRSASQVAFDCGFSSPQFFITSFKKRFGQTPDRFRKPRA